LARLVGHGKPAALLSGDRNEMTWLRMLMCALSMAGLAAPALAQAEFPFDSELILDADRMPGSRRIPNMEVDGRGGIAMEMWCNAVRGQFVVAGPTVTVLTGQPTQRECPPERVRADEALLTALSGVTGWRRNGSMLTLTGATTLRFRLPTN
jgi:heat shock protein HslJ